MNVAAVLPQRSVARRRGLGATQAGVRLSNLQNLQRLRSVTDTMAWLRGEYRIDFRGAGRNSAEATECIAPLYE